MTGCPQPPVTVSPYISAATASAVMSTLMSRARSRGSAPRSSATVTAAAHRHSCQPTKNQGEPRQVSTSAGLSSSVKNAKGAKNRIITISTEFRWVAARA